MSKFQKDYANQKRHTLGEIPRILALERVTIPEKVPVHGKYMAFDDGVTCFTH